MDLKYTEDDLLFREEVRAFISEAFTPDLQQQMARSKNCLLYTSPSPRDIPLSRMPSSA